MPIFSRMWKSKPLPRILAVSLGWAWLSANSAYA